MKDEIPYPHSATSVFVMRVKKGRDSGFIYPSSLILQPSLVSR